MASNSPKNNEHILRFSDIIAEPRRMLPPVQGFENMKLVTLEDAVQPLVSVVPQVDQMVWTVKSNITKPKNNLSIDEAASIMLYSMEWTPRENSFYMILNSTLRSENRQKLIPWFLYLRLFIYSLSKLPSATSRTIYRGVKMDLSAQYKKGHTFVWWGFSSCTLSVEVLESFLGTSGDRTIFNIECDSGKVIDQYSLFPKENEVLLLAARQFEVVSCLNAADGLHIIQLKEIKPPFPLISLPQVSNQPQLPSGFNRPLQNSRVTPEPSFIQTSFLTPTVQRENSNTRSHLSNQRSAPSSSICSNQKLQREIEACSDHSDIDLSGQKLTDDDIEIVVSQAIINKQCTELWLQSNKITSRGASIIASALNGNTTLKELYLYNNPLSDMGIESLSKALAHNNSSLKQLGLFSTGITNRGAQYLAQMLETNRTLICLQLSENEIGDQGVHLLVNVLANHNNTLEELYLSYNKLISNSSVDSFGQLFKRNQSLKELWIDNCNLSETTKEKLRQMAQQKNDFWLHV